MQQDFREAFRRVAQQPFLTGAVVMVLASAVTAVAVVVAIAHAVLLRPLPYRAAERVAVLWESNPRQQTLLELSYPDFLDWQKSNASFDELAAIGSVNWSHRLTGIGDPATVSHAAVSGAFFRVLGTAPHLGRVITDADDVLHTARVAVVSYGFWQRRLGGSPEAIGRTITLDDLSFEVVGVMPREFDFPRGAELWTALVPELDQLRATLGFDAMTDRGFGILFGVGHLAPGVSFDVARQDLDRVNAAIDEREGRSEPHPVVVTSLEDRLLGTTGPALCLLLMGVILILALCVANVVTLLLMRAMSTLQESAVRLALGATWARMFRLRLAEALMLFGAAAVVGLGASSLALPLVIRLAPESVYRLSDATLTPADVLSVAGLTLAAAMGASLIVAVVSMARARGADALTSATRSVSRTRFGTVQRALVAGQCALALVLLTAGSLTVQSLWNLRRLDLGFDPVGTLTLDVLPSPRLEKRANLDFYTPLLERLEEIGGVEAAGAAYQRPLAHDGIGMDAQVLPEGYAADDEAAWKSATITANREVVTPGYFAAMRIPIRQGRAFTDADTEQSPPVAILGESAARRLFPRKPALGRQLLTDAGPDGKPRWRTIVGVVPDVRYRGLQDVRADLYIPHRQMDDAVKHVIIRAQGEPLALIAEVRNQIRQTDPQAVVGLVFTMDALVAQAMAPWHLYMVLFGVLGALALLMTIVGVYATVRYAVVDRWQEWGIRSALGASARMLTRLVMRESLRPVLVGSALGYGLALGLDRLMRTILVGSQGAGLLVLAVAASFVALASVASYLPGRRAGRADPASLLRLT